MMTIRPRWQTAVGMLVILLLASACYQNIGEEASGPQISMVITETPTEEPSPTPTETEAPEETIEAQDADDAVDLPIADEPDTETPTPTETATATATETQVTEVAQLGDGGLGQLLETNTPESVDPFSLTATSIIATATAQVLVPTWTADALTAQANQLVFTPAPTTDPNFGLGLATATTGPVLNGSDCVHEVRAGETLFRLSMTYGIPVMDIANRNGITNPDLISVGQMLTINGCGTTGAFPPATSTPTESAFGLGGPNLGDSSAQVGGTASCVAQYTVNQYDNLFQISLRYGVPVQSIANANGISNINVIDMGSVLCIPGQ